MGDVVLDGRRVEHHHTGEGALRDAAAPGEAEAGAGPSREPARRFRKRNHAPLARQTAEQAGKGGAGARMAGGGGGRAIGAKVFARQWRGSGVRVRAIGK